MEKTERTPLFAPNPEAQYFPGPPVRAPPTGEYAEEGAAASPTRSPSTQQQQFSLDGRYKKKALMLDTDVHFVPTNIVTPNPSRANYFPIHQMLPARKLRLQIDPTCCVRELVPLVLGRVVIQPFTLHGLIARSQTGYELSQDDPVGEVAERGDSLRE